MRRSDPRSGVILVTVLWSIALLSALAMAAAVTFRGFAGVMAVERDRVKAVLRCSRRDLKRQPALLTHWAMLRCSTTKRRSTSPPVQCGRASPMRGAVSTLEKRRLKLIASLLRSVGASQAAANDIAQRIVERRSPGNTPAYECRA